MWRYCIVSLIFFCQIGQMLSDFDLPNGVKENTVVGLNTSANIYLINCNNEKQLIPDNETWRSLYVGGQGDVIRLSYQEFNDIRWGQPLKSVLDPPTTKSLPDFELPNGVKENTVVALNDFPKLYLINGKNEKQSIPDKETWQSLYVGGQGDIIRLSHEAFYKIPCGQPLKSVLGHDSLTTKSLPEPSSDNALTNEPHHEIHIRVIIARYKESVDHLHWLKGFPHTIYNRGDQLPSHIFHVHNCSENVGRESFIYLNHIVEHYHNLPNVTVFSQTLMGEPSYFSDGDFQATVQGLHSGELYLSPENDGFAFLNPKCASAKGHPSQDPVFTSGYKDLLDFVVDNPRYAGTGTFAVSRSAVHRNPVEYYRKLARMLGYEQNPLIGHFFERAWPEVFHSSCSAGLDYHCMLQPNPHVLFNRRINC